MTTNKLQDKPYDLAVVGGGHAGLESALAGARLGAKTVLITHAATEIGRMPCNPAIGGLGKGQLVREIDVLGGVMSRLIDKTGIQFRILNRRKGAAVQSPRAQADKFKYQAEAQRLIQTQAGLDLIEADAVDLLIDTAGEERRIAGVILDDGREVRARNVILSTGTFMGGLMHTGDIKTSGGRAGAVASQSLSPSLQRLGFQIIRLKTGTPPRLYRDSIDFRKLIAQPGDPHPTPFSFTTGDFSPQQIDCHMTYTNQATHDLIRKGLHKSPLFSGIIEGRGPRYCPSIEDKVVRFSEKDKHQVFLEPEGLNSDEIYVNGLSTSLPRDLQEDFIHSVEGLEGARFARYGYAVEYDSIPSFQVHASLEAKAIGGLWFAGQILGTSGYEEAAAQGLMAGVNAVRALDGRPPVEIRRDMAYIGVMIDDLVTKEITEPYRMFTSRAEHRLSLRCDNAESRLLGLSREIGLLSAPEAELLEHRVSAFEDLLRILETATSPGEGRRAIPALETLRHPAASVDSLDLMRVDGVLLREAIQGSSAWASLPQRLQGEVEFQAVTDVKYAGYILKHDKKLKKQQHLDHLQIPEAIDYMAMGAVSYEAREKLQKMRPDTLGQAARIDGVRSSDLAVLSVLISRERDRRQTSRD